MAPLVIREEMRKRHLVGTDRDTVPTCKAFGRKCVVLGFLSCNKCMEPLFIDSPAETYAVRFFTSGKVCVHLGRDANQRPPTRQPHALTTQPPRLHIYILGSIPGQGDTKIFADVGDYDATSFHRAVKRPFPYTE